MKLYAYITWLAQVDEPVVRFIIVTVVAVILGSYLYFRNKKKAKDV